MISPFRAPRFGSRLGVNRIKSREPASSQTRTRGCHSYILYTSYESYGTSYRWTVTVRGLFDCVHIVVCRFVVQVSFCGPLAVVRPVRVRCVRPTLRYTVGGPGLCFCLWGGAARGGPRGYPCGGEMGSDGPPAPPQAPSLGVLRFFICFHGNSAYLRPCYHALRQPVGAADRAMLLN